MAHKKSPRRRCFAAIFHEVLLFNVSPPGHDPRTPIPYQTRRCCRQTRGCMPNAAVHTVGIIVGHRSPFCVCVFFCREATAAKSERHNITSNEFVIGKAPVTHFPPQNCITRRGHRGEREAETAPSHYSSTLLLPFCFCFARNAPHAVLNAATTTPGVGPKLRRGPVPRLHHSIPRREHTWLNFTTGRSRSTVNGRRPTVSTRHVPRTCFFVCLGARLYQKQRHDEDGDQSRTILNTMT